MATKVEFEVAADQIKLTTQTNGDHIEIKGIHLGETQASNLAGLINLPTKKKLGTPIPNVLSVTIKEKK